MVGLLNGEIVEWWDLDDEMIKKWRVLEGD